MSNFEFVEWINAKMEEKRLRPAELARLSKISESQIGRIKKGEQGISIDTAVLLARGLGVSPIELFCKAAGIEPIEKDPDYIELAGYYSRLDEQRRSDLLTIAETYYRNSII